MAAEMAAQPQVLARLAARAAASQAAVRALVPSPLAGVVYLARGSSDNAAVFGRYLTEVTAGRPAGLAAPSLYTRYHAIVDWHGYLVVALSQSGSTPEIISTCQAMQSAGGTLIGITNEPASPLSAEVHLTLATDAGKELAVPATKTVTAQLLLLTTVATALSASSTAASSAAGDSLGAMAGAARAVLADPGPAAELARSWRQLDRLVVTGRGLGYAAALETALKIKETTGVLAEGISAADLLHGPIAVAYAGAPVLLVDTGGPAATDIAGLRGLLARRQADVVSLPFPPGMAGLPEVAMAVAAVIRGQQLARSLALAKGTDPDHPAGLRKITATT